VIALEALSAWEQSHLTVREFAEREGISAKRLERWRSRLSIEEGGAPAFVELTPRGGATVERDADASVLEVVLTSGRVVRVPSDFDASALRRLVVALEEVPC
jgi:hypothetical protein